MKIGLIGNPNVGKSLIFSQLTGVGVEISNYPGTTVDLCSGTICHERRQIEVVDLPGAYSLDGSGPEEQLVRETVVNRAFDVYAVILDATHLERNLYLLLQLLEFNLPVVVILNIIDEAAKTGLTIDVDHLSSLIGVPVIATAASLGRNIDQIIPLALTGAKPGTYPVQYDLHIEAAIRSLERLTSTGRAEALLALQGIGTDMVLMDAATTIIPEIIDEHRMSVHQLIAANRHHAASRIAAAVVKKESPGLFTDLDQFLTRPFPGIPIMLLFLASMLTIVFMIGSYLEEIIVSIFEFLIVSPIRTAGLDPLLSEVLLSLMIAIQAGLGVAFPYVFTFYLLISLVEDSGYMTRIAFLADRVMHRFGLHGQAIIPMVLGLGCNVPAIMGIRQLGTRRERTIAAVLITMVPCSARTVIIAGIIAAFIGIAAALSLYLIVFLLIIVTGIILSRITPGNPLGMVLELPPLRKPRIYQVITRAWLHIREFLVIAMPLLMVSSVVLGLAGFYGITDLFQNAVAPFMEQVLGLPGFASTALLFGILRKEMAFETLIVLAGTANLPSVMTSLQLYTFALVSTLFVPCISTIAVLSREMGWKTAFLISCYTLLLGIGAGAVLHLVAI
ncbi:MAG: ferrous iron transport protein B [Methanospirillum sp.]|uniref:ferrous iron transport protein B n=1 Tax=Methanospirillum sp. TaxID=45200 RepID=UPI0023746994|nr:ferrous iron transport protein B [Methanospirillum sp.]MDD1728256.1 ferrous iron transport protein B [Methanospirillum sp.]